MATQATQQRGVSEQGDPQRHAPGEHPSHTVALTHFGGVNLSSPRERIGDDEFAWLEEVIPIAPGNLAAVNGPGTAIVTVTGETGAPSYTLDFNVNGVTYVFAVWSNSGNAWIGTISGTGWTKIAAGTYTSGKTAAAQWNNLGLLIVDSVTGYYDWNVTTANTLTNLSGQVYGPVTDSTLPNVWTQAGAPTVTLRIRDLAGTGSGATIGASLSAVSAVVVAGGTGYQVGDTLTLVGGTLTTNTKAPASQISHATVLTVTAVSGGAVTGISFKSVGYYQVAPNPNPVSGGGGHGSGATFTVTWAIDNFFIITPGSLYGAQTALVEQSFDGGTTWANAPVNVFSSGTTLGTAIAVYAGRVWIAIKRTVQFTEVNSYNNFGGSGSAFTINDSYLINNITALYAANNYLYIAGDESIDILSNVTVSGGVASFSRVNATASIGTNQPLSVFPWLRTIAFANASGFYALSGATPEKISEKLDSLITALNFAQSVYGVQVTVNNLLCAAFLFNFKDSFTQTPTVSRNMLAVLYKGKWWFTSQLPVAGSAAPSAVISVPVGTVQQLYGWVSNTLYPLMTSATNVNPLLLKTKFWDGESPMVDKQGIQAAIGAVFLGLGGPGLKVNIDTEKSSVLSTVGSTFPLVQWINNAGQAVTWQNKLGQLVQWQLPISGYYLFEGAANNGGGKYMGLTVTATGSNISQIRLLALEMKKTRR